MRHLFQICPSARFTPCLWKRGGNPPPQRNHQLTDAFNPPSLPSLLKLCHHPFGINITSPLPNLTSLISPGAPPPHTASRRTRLSSPCIISSPRILDPPAPPIFARASRNNPSPRRGGISRTTLEPASWQNKFGFGSRCQGV